MEREDKTQFPAEKELLLANKIANQAPQGDVAAYGKESTRITCQFCQEEVLTRLNFKSGVGTHCCAVGLCVLGCVRFCLLALH